MNKNSFSSLESAISILSRSKNLGIRIRFSLYRSAIGVFFLDGKVEELSDKQFLFVGEHCNALIDRESCTFREVEDLTMPDSEYSFNFRFVLDFDNYFLVTGLDPVPSDTVN